MKIQCIIGGDFNCVLDNEIDRLNCKRGRDVGQVELLKIMNHYDLEDVFRRRHPLKRCYTWSTSENSSRIDYWLISRVIDYKAKSVDVKSCPFSNHDSICLKMQTSSIERSRGLWKFNTELLEYSPFVEEFRLNLALWKTGKCQYDNVKIWWDIVKGKI